MKKFVSLMIVCALLASLAGCATTNDISTESADSSGSLSSVDLPDEPAVISPESKDTSAASKSNDESSAADVTTPISTTAVATAPVGTATDTAAGIPTDGAEYEAVEDAADGDFFYDIATDDSISFISESIAADDSISWVDEGEYPEAPTIQPEAGLLTGGEWNDNDNWHDWISLYQTHEEWNEYRDLWAVDFDVRHEIIVTAYGEPVEGAQVVQKNCGNIGVTSAVTDNEGKAYLFLEECNDDMAHTLEVTYGEVRMTIENVDPTSSGTYTIDFSESSLSQDEVSDVEALELMLMIDTTGSMRDELTYLQKEMEDVITRVKQENANIPIRVSVNFYRDEGDDYVIREFEFTDDIEKALADLAEQEAKDGGDTPEAVHTALNSVTKNHEWKDNATKLMFFVLDAPPHDDAQIIDEVNNYVELAAAQGIRIIPVASSGIDKATEYLLRTMAFRTGGTYTFLTDHSGIGGDHIEPTIGDYEVEKLNDMMVRIINDYVE